MDKLLQQSEIARLRGESTFSDFLRAISMDNHNELVRSERIKEKAKHKELVDQDY